MSRDFDPYKLSSPRVFLVRMIIFLVIAAFVPLVLYRQLATGFMANPGLNGLILGVLFIGIALAFRNVVLLMPEVRWVNSFRRRDMDPTLQTPRLLAPMATLLRDRADSMALSTSTWRSILDSIATRLDENREILRYMTGLLVFLGLLGTFWGLITTIGAVSSTIQALDVTAGSTATIFESLKSGLQAPLAGMGIAFSSSLFGLASSLVLGFLDLQAGQAQNRFYTELEDWLSTITDLEGLDLEEAETGNAVQEIKLSVERLSRSVQEGGGRAATTAMANLAEGIQALVQHMRGEQQMVRDWVEAQAEQQRALQRALNRLAEVSDRASARRPVEPDEDRPAKVVAEYRREG
ncbi:flagellar motor protein MotA [Rhizobiales bacterium L72]|uniref:Flagellar motor protein MotA n=2 Tax=Propylenella binzhouense TaxID=2555902 RepID=A0A964T653_9HYPH|nr:MotA/TolQ/ExbB proton channel family protein [Propylenella binzhouense]MYZ48117.1 flagellar motor protein MotA [Propylenella binzhouense]